MCEPAGKVDTDIQTAISTISTSTSRIAANIDVLDEEQVHAPSLLPGWTRGHVLTHLARSADSRVRLLNSAASGVPIPQYANERARDDEVDKGAPRPPALIIKDFLDAQDRFAAAVQDLSPDRWSRKVPWLGDVDAPVWNVLTSRLRELEVHHVDLDVGYRPEDWSGDFVDSELKRAAKALRDSKIGTLVALKDNKRYQLGAAELEIRGAGYLLLAWLLGRNNGDEISVVPPGPLPIAPAWE